MAKRESKIINSTLELVKSESTIEGARDKAVRQDKLSMLSKPNKIKALIPDLSASEAELKALGLELEDGKWYVSNRQYFPNPLGNDSIIINYGRKDDGSVDLGFCSQEEFAKIYAHTDKYDQGEITYVDPETLKMGELIDATKCATGEFTLMPEGTTVKTNEGDVVIAPGQALIVNENKNSVFASDISEILKRYVADTMNPASKKAFELLSSYEAAKQDKSPAELSELFSNLVTEYKGIERKIKTYKAYSTETDVESLRGDFSRAAELVKKLDLEISTRINSLQFKERLGQAKEVLQSIMSDERLTPEQRDVKISYVQARLLPKTNNHQHLKGSVPMETLLERATKHNFGEEQISDIKNAYTNGLWDYWQCYPHTRGLSGRC
jgi:hypothetical protein